MEFDSDWLTLGRHRVRLRFSRGFPTEMMHSVAEVVRLAIDDNMSACARLVEIVFEQDGPTRSSSVRPG
jgi:DNA gyrase/topoisomerase IV subunit B